MLYSANHCIALFNLYAERFGHPVPPDMAMLAARTGTHQRMMHAIDGAIRDNQPITDWQACIQRMDGQTLAQHAARQSKSREEMP